VVIRKPLKIEPATVYASYPRQGGGRSHLMPVTLWASEVSTPTARNVSAWIVPMIVHTGPFGDPLSIGIVEDRVVHVETS
jgi:hypothetical protein